MRLVPLKHHKTASAASIKVWEGAGMHAERKGRNDTAIGGRQRCSTYRREKRKWAAIIRWWFKTNEQKKKNMAKRPIWLTWGLICTEPRCISMPHLYRFLAKKQSLIVIIIFLLSKDLFLPLSWTYWGMKGEHAQPSTQQERKEVREVARHRHRAGGGAGDEGRVQLK